MGKYLAALLGFALLGCATPKPTANDAVIYFILPGMTSASGAYQPTYFDNVEMRDDRMALFASYLPAGVYTYSYLARATTPGAYGVLPAHAYLSYFPDVFGRSDGGRFTVGEK